nr:MAG TPA: hypothetical protein [Caudoviricetes sp.]
MRGLTFYRQKQRMAGKKQDGKHFTAPARKASRSAGCLRKKCNHT